MINPFEDLPREKELKPILDMSHIKQAECYTQPVDPHAPGTKLDQDKPRTSLVLKDFSLSLIEVCKVGTIGAAKYSDHGWLSVDNGIERYESALFRHLLNRRETDDESGLLHAAHAAWNALAVLELKLRNQE